MTDEPLTVAQMADLRAAFTESDLPFRVDLVDWANTSDDFRRVIAREHVAIAAGGTAPEPVRWRETTLDPARTHRDREDAVIRAARVLRRTHTVRYPIRL